MTKKQLIFIAVKIVFAAFVVTWLLRRVDAVRVWDTITEANGGYIVAATVLCWCGVMMAGWRWYRLLAAVEIHIPLRDLLCVAQIGQFFLMFLPGPAGDDLTRMLYLSRLAKDRVGTACGAVVLDRFIGLASILALAAVCLPLQWELLNQTTETRWLAVMMLIGGSAVVIAAVFFFATPARIVRNAIEWALRRAHGRRAISGILNIAAALVRHRRLVVEVCGAAVMIQVLLCCVYYLAGLAVGITASPLLWLSFVPIVLVANAVPITVAGFGVREYLFLLFLGNLAHVADERSLAAAVIVFGITLLVCLWGGVVYIFYRAHTARQVLAARARETEGQQVSPREAQIAQSISVD